MPKFLQRHRHIPEGIALIGAVIYLGQAVYNLIFQLPNLDEGAYLFKGYQFAVGTYHPFQINGFWTNKMYLSFMIWGWIQKLFSPGLLAPRIFAIVFGVLSLLGTWIIARRMSNRWIAALSVLALALNPALIGIYSLANSQVMVVFLLTWILVLTLGPARPRWQILLGAFLSGILVFLRENMIFVVPLLLVYLFWQNGKKTGFLAAGTALTVLLIGHLIYWPEITYLWSRWIPKLNSFFSAQSISDTNSSITQISNLSKVHSFTVALRTFLVPFLCSLSVLTFWPRKERWQSLAHFRAAWFLLVTYLILLASHLWAALGNDYCIYCSTTYLAFFGNLGLMLFAVCYSSLNKEPRIYKRILFFVLIPVTISGVWYSWFESIGMDLMEIQVPRMSGGKILPGTALLWQILQNKFQVDMPISRQLLPAVFGFLSGLLLVFLLYLSFHYFVKEKNRFTYLSSNILIILGIFLSPLFTASNKENYCTTNVPKMYKTMASSLQEEIPTGSNVYIEGRLAMIPLLYLTEVGFYPPQLNDNYSFRNDDQSEDLLVKGLWNEELANKWQQEADYFIIGANKLDSWQDLVKKLDLVEIAVENVQDKCPISSQLHFFRKE